MSPTPVPGTVWTHQLGNTLLRVIQVASRTAKPDHFVLTLDNRPIGPGRFPSKEAAVGYANQEWAVLAYAEGTIDPLSQ